VERLVHQGGETGSQHRAAVEGGNDYGDHRLPGWARGSPAFGFSVRIRPMEAVLRSSQISIFFFAQKFLTAGQIS
jgi:hypothetical protein